MSRDKEQERFLHEIVELERDCELGEKGERAIVLAIVCCGNMRPTHMTLCFFNRAAFKRTVHTGADYAYLRMA
jgi:hypothetical protein